MDIATRERKVILRGGNNPRFARTGHLVYGYSRTLRAIPFDPARLEVKGESVRVVERVMTKPTGGTNFAVTDDGTLLYVEGGSQSDARILVWVDRQGKEELVAGTPTRGYVYPRISPGGNQIALDIRDQTSDIWTWDLDRRVLTKLTLDRDINRGIAWSHDGKRLAFSAVNKGQETVFWQSADGTGNPEPLTQGNGRPQVPYSFTPDGLLLFGEPGAPPFDVYAMAVKGDRKVEPLLASAYSEHNAEVSPNGKWVAYQSNESGRDEIYVRPFPAVSGSRRQISIVGGTRPLWSRDGRELFYLAPGQGRMMSVPVVTEGEFRAAEARTLFEGPYFRGPTGRTYDVSPDGKRFLMIRSAAGVSETRPQMVVVLNWMEELKRLVPIR